MIKHGPETDLEELDFEAVDKEIEADEVAQAAQTAVSTRADLHLIFGCPACFGAF